MSLPWERIDPSTQDYMNPMIVFSNKLCSFTVVAIVGFTAAAMLLGTAYSAYCSYPSLALKKRTHNKATYRFGRQYDDDNLESNAFSSLGNRHPDSSTARAGDVESVSDSISLSEGSPSHSVRDSALSHFFGSVSEVYDGEEKIEDPLNSEANETYSDDGDDDFWNEVEEMSMPLQQQAVRSPLKDVARGLFGVVTLLTPRTGRKIQDTNEVALPVQSKRKNRYYGPGRFGVSGGGHQRLPTL